MMLNRIAKIALVIALTSSVSGCFFGPGWGPHGGGWHDHRYYEGGGPGYYRR